MMSSPDIDCPLVGMASRMAADVFLMKLLERMALTLVKNNVDR